MNQNLVIALMALVIGNAFLLLAAVLDRYKFQNLTTIQFKKIKSIQFTIKILRISLSVLLALNFGLTVYLDTYRTKYFNFLNQISLFFIILSSLFVLSILWCRYIRSNLIHNLDKNKKYLYKYHN